MKDSRVMQTVAYEKDRIRPNEKGHQDKMHYPHSYGKTHHRIDCFFDLDNVPFSSTEIASSLKIESGSNLPDGSRVKRPSVHLSSFFIENFFGPAP